jgi:CRISPR/Cas system-associated exonuclease Cas4 (RecB family)
LVSVPLQIGAVTHECISTILNRLLKNPTDPVDSKRLAEYIGRKATTRHRDAHYAEVYYGQRTEIGVEEVATRVRDAVASLIGSGRFAWLTEQASRQGAPWVVDPEGYGETRVDGLKAYCKVDFLIPADGFLYILDWKTGREREEKHSTQIRGYAAWASYHFDTPINKIVAVLAYPLPEYKESSVTLNEYDMQDFAGLVRGQTHEMQAMCSDIEQNVPLPKSRFPLTTIPSLCAYCNYRELCGRAPRWHERIPAGPKESPSRETPDRTLPNSGTADISTVAGTECPPTGQEGE